MLATIPFVLTGILRYQLISDPYIQEKEGKDSEIITESPEEVLLKDKGIQFTISWWKMNFYLLGWATAIQINWLWIVETFFT